MKKAKEQIRVIQDKLTSESDLDTDYLWNIAVKKYQNNYADSIEIFNVSYSSRADAFASLFLLSLSDLAKEIGGSSSVAKDF